MRSGLGLGVVAQTVMESGPGPNDSNKTLYRTFWPSGTILSLQRKAISSCGHIILMTQTGLGNKSDRIDFVGDFRISPPRCSSR
jgi:hypothetical protein